jgi:hypothetical protein
MRSRTTFASLILVAAFASLASAQRRPPIRQLGAVTAKSSEALSVVAGIRPLPDGRVFINDNNNRRVLLFDPALKTFTVVADSTSATANAFSGRLGGLIKYRGDSTIFADPTSLSMLVIDPNGKVARVMSVPRSQDAMMLANQGPGGASVDASGRLIYRAPPNLPRPTFSPGGAFTMPEIPDSAAIVRMDLVSRHMDTLGFIRTPKVKVDVTRDDNGRITAATQINPLPVVDEWAVLSDGSVAFVRGRDYHLDFVRPDGSGASAAKIPFEWQRLTDEDKVAFIDSLKAARARLGANAPMVGLGGAAGAVMGGGGPQMVIIAGPGGAAGPGPGGTGGAAGSGGPGGPGGSPNVRVGGGPGGAGVQMNFVPASELPDYKPPFFVGSVRADTEGNLWIRTIPTKAIPGGPVYDVINQKGELVDRVQIPENRTIVGFGADGAVYLAARDNTTVYLERAKVR